MLKLSRVHVCFQQSLNESRPKKKCKCRKKVSISEATRLVEQGTAQWLILDRYTVIDKEVCPICSGGSLKKGCQNCGGSGKIETQNQVEVLGNDIVLATAASQEKNRPPVYRSVLALKTPRVATVERSHIEKAYLDGNKDEADRIEAYGMMILEARIEMGIGVEPPDNPETGTGRRYDYGRTPFARISDERTGIGKTGAKIVE